MFYLDASFVIAAMTHDEVHSKKSRNWLRVNPEAALAISRWVDTEVSSATSLKIRTGEISAEQRTALLTHWRTFRDASTSILAIENQDFEAAAHFAERHALSLRASDALHIAVAYGAGCTLVTLDQRMADAAIELGVPVVADL